jgi:hypothetical protein
MDRLVQRAHIAPAQEAERRTPEGHATQASQCHVQSAHGSHVLIPGGITHLLSGYVEHAKRTRGGSDDLNAAAIAAIFESSTRIESPCAISGDRHAPAQRRGNDACIRMRAARHKNPETRREPCTTGSKSDRDVGGLR